MKSFLLSLFFLGAISFSCLAYADNLETIKDIAPDGVIYLSGGQNAQLGGIKVSNPDWLSLKPFLLNKPVKIKPWRMSDDRPSGKAWVYTNQFYIKLPFKKGDQTSSSEVTLNQWLIEIGFAEVSREEFSEREQFEKSESEAKLKGLGIWSAEENPLPKKTEESVL